MAALLLRILYYLFPQIDWGFVFVDDFCWLLRLPTGPQFTAALLGTLVALGTPLSWKKTNLAEINTWLGFVIHPSIPRVQMAAPKHIKVMELLEELSNGSPMSAKAIEKAMGRIQWATACCPLTKSLLQPLWAWKMAVNTMGHPPKVVRMLAALLKEPFTHPFEQYSPFLPKSPWWGCSDASASKTGEAFVGGWCSTSPNPTKDQVLWFHYAITADAHPWAFKDGNPQKRIAALELLGTLLLCKHLVAQQGQMPGRVRLPVGSDNSGNIFSLLNLSAKKPYSAALLMELVLFLHCEGCSIAPNHIPREFNTWADELTHPDFEGFSLDRRLPAPETLFVLNRLFLAAHPRSRDRIRWAVLPTLSPGTLTGACWLWEARGHSGVAAETGESYCLTHPCPPWRSPGQFEMDQTIQGLGRTPASTKAHGKSMPAAFCALGIFLTSGYIEERKKKKAGVPSYEQASRDTPKKERGDPECCIQENPRNQRKKEGREGGEGGQEGGVGRGTHQRKRGEGSQL